jgi:hypothetical protein
MELTPDLRRRAAASRGDAHATSMEGVHYVLHAAGYDTYADLPFTMIERRDKLSTGHVHHCPRRATLVVIRRSW